jgi:catechol 2,3-dioxygenase
VDAPEIGIGAVRLTVADLDRVQGFYERAIGLSVLDGSGEAVRLGANGTNTVIELTERSEAPEKPPGATGLFHLAIVVPSRLELARTLRRVADAGWRFSGASDHLVSEALYLSDPEGNGIEIYRDRPREQWRYSDGKLQMATYPLDLEDLAGELRGADPGPQGAAAGTRIGHVHLQVGDLEAAGAFYRDLLGFEVTVEDYPGALFLSVGGYHHHIGLNTWAGEGAPTPPRESRGLRWFEVVLPDAGELERVAERLREAGVEVETAADGVHVADPSGNGVLLRTRAE